MLRNNICSVDRENRHPKVNQFDAVVRIHILIFVFFNLWEIFVDQCEVKANQLRLIEQ